MKKIILIGIGVLLFAFGAWHFFGDTLDYYRGKQTYSQLEQYAAVPSALKASPTQAQAKGTESAAEEPIPEETLPPVRFPEVDFASLQQINSEIIGWIYSENTTINYPVAHNIQDNFFYLDHMFTREGNGSGCIYLDQYNAGDFTDDNSIIYGHNMQNGTMFASLMEYKKTGYFEKHPRILLVTKEHKYALEIFAGIITDPKSEDWKTTYSDRAGYAAWLESAKERSVFNSPVVPTAEDRIVSLSTCTYEFDDARLLILGVMKEYE